MKRYTHQEIKRFVSEPLFDEKIILNKDLYWPKISIVTPSYNQAQFLEKTILSVLNQNYPNLEFIIIDGGSTDESMEIIKKYKKYLAYWVSEKDKGQADAINKGFKLTTGDWIGWQNSDDIYLPGVLHKVAWLGRNNPKPHLLYANLIFIDSYDNITGMVNLCPVNLITFVSDGVFPHNQSAFWSKEALRQLGLINVNLDFSIDYDYFLRFFIKNINTKFIHDYWGGFRLYNDSKSSNIIEICRTENLKIINDYGLAKYNNNLYKILSQLFRFGYYILTNDYKYLFYLMKVWIKKSGYFYSKD